MSKKEKTEEKNVGATCGRPPESEDVASAEDRLAELNDRYLRLSAEYDNFRKRSAKEKADIADIIKANTAGAFLSVKDNLERALEHAADGDPLKSGVEMTLTQLNAAFDTLGIAEIDCAEKTFDPEVMNAVMGSGERVAQVLQKGYRLGERILRTAMVAVEESEENANQPAVERAAGE